ncbi:hypothetical protein AM305_02608 [Actinobacillus minor NM305]|uniref:Uncharacterized protein n=2 Tax=Actinobacillus TaxID=713 RepID=C5S4D6_9PAST|nr:MULTISPECIES: hypothetical protein [Actinobacillus]EER46228.1 hypothetical protein AM305_02608 [Actinobacillus minor NM305]CAO03062.1 hypothetical protein [Actinobacillus porcitonsillarum]CAP19935.1 hypothetical protein [Actinobacillus porcitonsillarum]
MKIKIKSDLNEYVITYTLFFDGEVEMVSGDLRAIMERISRFFRTKEMNGALLHVNMDCNFNM